MKNLRSTLTLICALAVAPTMAQQVVPWEEAYRKADQLIEKLTTEEKINFTVGYSKFFFYGVPEKGIPFTYLSDATQGVHIRNNLPDTTMVQQLERATAMPCPIMLAATFNPQLSYDYAHAVGEECRAGGVEILLGPGLNIYRNAQCGRNFEYMGEDPYLASAMAVEYVKGMQSTGTAACVKHFVCNNTEFYRRRSNSVVDERALHEIYLPAFQAAIDAGVGYVMTSYNQLNGEWCGQNKHLIEKVLRQEMGFKGCVMSDWRSVYDTRKMVLSGQNAEMPGRSTTPDEIRNLLSSKQLSESNIDQMIRPQIAAGIAFGFYDREKYKPEVYRLEEHQKVAAEVATEGVVLLKNNGILPLDPTRKVLVVGKFIDQIPGGGGSAATVGYNTISLRKALTAELGDQVAFAEKATAAEMKAADLLLISTGTMDSESFERPFAMHSEEEKLVATAVKSNPNTIVLVNSGSGIRMSRWNDQAAAILYGWYPGQNGYAAIAQILTGKLNPSGKLPMTIEREFSDSPANGTIPAGGEFYDKAPRAYNEDMIALYDVNYKESVWVGYRWYESQKIEPLYPFGFGLSYTSFSLAKPKLSAKTISAEKPLTVTVELTNTGKKAGAEVVQLYVSEDKPSVVRPVKELKRFAKISLQPGESRKIKFELTTRDLAFWNDTTHAWMTNSGSYTLSIGTSSADISQRLPVSVQ